MLSRDAPCPLPCLSVAFLAAGKDSLSSLRRVRPPGDGVIAAAKLMLNPTARQLCKLAEDVRAAAAQMRDPKAKQMMTRLALTYDRLAEFAELRDANDAARDKGRTA